MAGEHPTDNIEHDLPEEYGITLKGEALMTARTIAEAQNCEPGEVVAHALGIEKFLWELAKDGSIILVSHPNGSMEKITLPFLQ